MKNLDEYTIEEQEELAAELARHPELRDYVRAILKHANETVQELELIAFQYQIEAGEAGSALFHAKRRQKILDELLKTEREIHQDELDELREGN